jgi:hypothetical protein
VHLSSPFRRVRRGTVQLMYFNYLVFLLWYNVQLHWTLANFKDQAFKDYLDYTLRNKGFSPTQITKGFS